MIYPKANLIFVAGGNSMGVLGFPFVTMYSSWNSIDVEPFVHNYFCHGKGLLIRCYKCLAEFGKGISQDKDILPYCSLKGSFL